MLGQAHPHRRYRRGETQRDRAGGPDLHGLGIAPAASATGRRASAESCPATGSPCTGGCGARDRRCDHRRGHGSMAGGSLRNPHGDPVDLATATPQADSLPSSSRTLARIRICPDGQAAPAHRQCPGRCGRPGGGPSRCADAQRGCASSSGTDPANGRPAGTGRARAIAAIFPSRSPTWCARHRTVGAMAADSTNASARSNCGCTTGAHRSAGWAAGNVDRCPSARSSERACRHMAA